jgi:hypothetical protein
MDEPVEEQADGAVARVAAIDIAKASAVVCLRLPHESREGLRLQQVWPARRDDQRDPGTG